MIKLSVGLISGELVWLALESLIRQKTDFKWELLIAEQSNRSQMELYKSYIPKLQKVNCVQVRIIPVKSYPKTRELIFSQHISPKSDVLVIHEHDTYSHSTRLQESLESKHNIVYTDYVLSYSPGKKKFVQQPDRLNYCINFKNSGILNEVNKDGFVVRKTTAPYLFQDDKLEDKTELVQKVNEIKDVYSTVHFVYVYIDAPPLHGGPMWRELYYSVKSIERFFKGLPYKIFVVGDNPKLKNVTHIPCERFKGRLNAKVFDATKKLLKIADTQQINEDFIYMYDDIVLLKEVTIDTFTQIIAIDHVESPKEYWKHTARRPSDEWITPFNHTILKLKSQNLPTYNYETHLPRYFNKERIKQIINKYKLEQNVYMFSTLYYNNFFTKPDVLLRGTNHIKADLTIPIEDYDMDKFVKGRIFLNYNDMGLNRSLQKFIKNLFL